MTAPVWYAITDASGNLVSVGTETATSDALTAAGLTATALPGQPQAGLVWDPQSMTFGTPPAGPNPTKITSYAFAKRFQPAEYAALRAAADPQVQQFLLEFDLAPGGLIDLSTTDIQNGLLYLVSIGLLTQSRATAIGTP